MKKAALSVAAVSFVVKVNILKSVKKEAKMNEPVTIFFVELHKNRWRVRRKALGRTLNFLKDTFDTEQVGIASAIEIARHNEPSVVIKTVGNVAHLIFPRQERLR